MSELTSDVYKFDMALETRGLIQLSTASRVHDNEHPLHIMLYDILIPKHHMFINVKYFTVNAKKKKFKW